MVLLDTNICIYLIKKQSPSIVEKLKSVPMDSLGISSITLAELEFGIAKSKFQEKNQQALQNFLLPFVIYPFDDLAAMEYGNLRYYLEKKGKTIGSLDLLIAAHALSLKSTLITNNVKEFKRVPKLLIENWK